ncbi:M48 family metallopeptidase [Haloplanus halophilus]|uniref:M48 family metallopeptidase n=1 Tax=Haloplanus halophilus TaxID=2949993 RepID=UPI00203C51C5|nr:M48 family metalloprotease [Haloplanus sp. GDY1]
MRRSGQILLALLAVLTLLAYGTLALLTYWALLVLWARRPDPVVTVVLGAALTLALGYASYRLGTARIRYALDADELPRSAAPELHRRVETLADRLGVAPPRLLVAPMPQPNALALGGARDGDVVLARSLFSLLTAAELEAIVAHELAHLKGRDSLVKTLGYSLVRTVTGVVWLLVLPLALLVGGVARALALLRGDDPVQFRRTVRVADAAMTSLVAVCLFALTAVVQAYSRHREYAADDAAARLTGSLALASALEKIDRAATPDGVLSPLLVHGDEEGPVTDLLASHPPMTERIERLRRRRD